MKLLAIVFIIAAAIALVSAQDPCKQCKQGCQLLDDKPFLMRMCRERCETFACQKPTLFEDVETKSACKRCQQGCSFVDDKPEVYHKCYRRCSNQYCRKVKVALADAFQHDRCSACKVSCEYFKNDLPQLRECYAGCNTKPYCKRY
jgi:hypothetical protein